MSGFGGYCALPLRLGGSATEGWTAIQHARGAADIVALVAAVPFAWITFTKAGAVFSLAAYNGVNSFNLTGSDATPQFADQGTGITRLTFDATFEDEYERVYSFAIRSAQSQAHGTTESYSTVTKVNPTTIDVRTFNGADALTDAKVTVAVWAWVHPMRIGHYDGATDKHDVITERTPYAWIWYNEYESALGTAFTTASTGLVHAHKLALARNETGVQRAAEKITNNARPGTADDMLGEWVQILHVRADPEDTRHEIRQRAAARFEATRGNSREDVDAVIASILGDYLIRIVRHEGTDLATPPGSTFWPTVNPGDAAYNLGGGTWTSSRSHITIEVQRPNDINDERFFRIIRTELPEALDILLPAWATYNVATEYGDDGFNLSVDLLGYTGLTI